MRGWCESSAGVQFEQLCVGVIRLNIQIKQQKAQLLTVANEGKRKISTNNLGSFLRFCLEYVSIIWKLVSLFCQICVANNAPKWEHCDM